MKPTRRSVLAAAPLFIPRRAFGANWGALPLDRVPMEVITGLLTPLRDEGVLLLGSGNLVHNLREADLSEVDLPVAPWAAEFDEWVGGRIARGDLDALVSLAGAPNARRAHPTLEHYAPVVACAAAAGGDAAAFPITGFEHASLSLRSVRWG